MTYSREQLIDRIRQTAASIGFPPEVAVAQLKRESANFADRYVYGPSVGTSGEKGLAQFMPDTWARFGVGMHSNAFDPDMSLTAWAAYTNYLSGLFGNDLTKILQGYNGGEGHVIKGNVSPRARRYASEILAEAGIQGSTDGGTGDPNADDSVGFSPWFIFGGIALLAVVVFAFDD